MNTCRAKKIETIHCLLGTACFTLAALLALYVYFLSAAVVHVVIQKEGVREINSLHSEVSQLEAEYIAGQHAVSSQIASMEGFTTVEEKIFITKGDSSLVLLTEN